MWALRYTDVPLGQILTAGWEDIRMFPIPPFALIFHKEKVNSQRRELHYIPVMKKKENGMLPGCSIIMCFFCSFFFLNELILFPQSQSHIFFLLKAHKEMSRCSMFFVLFFLNYLCNILSACSSWFLLSQTEIQLLLTTNI